MKNVVRNKIRVIEEKLTIDYYQSVEARGETPPAALAPMKPRVTYTQVENNNPNKPLESSEEKALREIAVIADKMKKKHEDEEEAARLAQQDLLQQREKEIEAHMNQ